MRQPGNYPDLWFHIWNCIQNTKANLNCCPMQQLTLNMYRGVEAAKQAVDQIYDVIQFRKVVNIKGDLPQGYHDGQSKTVNGVGSVDSQ